MRRGSRTRPSVRAGTVFAPVLDQISGQFCHIFAGPFFGPENGLNLGPIFCNSTIFFSWAPNRGQKMDAFLGPFSGPDFAFFAKNWPPAGHAGRQTCPCLWARRPKLSLRQQGIMQFFEFGAPGVLGPRSEARNPASF